MIAQKFNEGTQLQISCMNDVDQRFVLTDVRADTSTLQLGSELNHDTTTPLTQKHYTTISSSAVYFLQETESGKFEVYFGDGATSADLSDGNSSIKLCDNK